MSDENNTPIDMPVEREPEQPFFGAIHENIDVTRVPHRMLRAAARACLALAEVMVEEAVTNARNNDWKELVELRKTTGEEISALTNMVRDRDHEIGELKALIEKREELWRAEEIYNRSVEGMAEDLKTAQEGWKSVSDELTDARGIISRQLEENKKLWADNIELTEMNKSLKEARRALCETIETLANVIRNS